MANEQKEYPKCNAFADHLAITVENVDQVDEKNNIIYFMESDAAHLYFKNKWDGDNNE